MDVIASRVEYRSSVFIKTVFTPSLGQNVGLGEGWAGSFPERYNDPMLLGKDCCDPCFIDISYYGNIMTPLSFLFAFVFLGTRSFFFRKSLN